MNDPFSGVVAARRNTSVISDSVYALDTKLVSADGKALDPETEQTILTKFASSAPEIYTLQDFLKRVITLQHESGAAIIRKIVRRGRLRELRLYSAADLSIIVSSDGKEVLFRSYKYRDVFSQKDAVVFSQYPSSSIPGEKALHKDLQDAITLSKDISKYNKTFFEQGIKYSLFLIYKRALTEEQKREVIKTLARRSPKFGGAHLPHILGGEIDLKSFSEIFNDVEFTKGREQTVEDVNTAFGVPPAVAGMMKRTPYNTARYQLKAFWQLTLLPLLKRLKSVLDAEILDPFFNARLILDFSAVEELYADPIDAATAVRTYRDLGLSWEEIAYVCNLPKLAKIGKTTNDTSLSLEKKIGAVKNSFSLSREDVAESAGERDATEKAAATAAILLLLEESVLRYTRSVISGENTTFSFSLTDDETEALEKVFLETQARAKSSLVEAFGEDIISSLDETSISRVAKMKYDESLSIFISRLEEKARLAYEAAGAEAADVAINAAVEAAMAYADQYAEATAIVMTQSSVEMTKNAALGQVQKIFDEEFRRAKEAADEDPLNPKKYVQRRIAFKQWRTVGDDRVRPSHREIEGETVNANDIFSNTCAYPGDTSAPMSEWINCRCYMVLGSRTVTVKI